MLIGGTLQTAKENESHLTEKDQLIVLKNELVSMKITAGDHRKKIKKLTRQVFIHSGILGVLIISIALIGFVH